MDLSAEVEFKGEFRTVMTFTSKGIISTRMVSLMTCKAALHALYGPMMPNAPIYEQNSWFMSDG